MSVAWDSAQSWPRLRTLPQRRRDDPGYPDDSVRLVWMIRLLKELRTEHQDRAHG